MKTHDEYHDRGLPSSGVAELEPDEKAETTTMEQAVANEQLNLFTTRHVLEKVRNNSIERGKMVKLKNIHTV